MKKLIVLFLCCLVLGGCGSEANKTTNEITTTGSEVQKENETTEVFTNKEIDNSDNREKIGYERIEPSLIMAFVDMGVVAMPKNISISSTELNNNKVNVQLRFDLDGKRLYASGTIDNNVPNSNIELWDIYLDGENRHYYWMSDNNSVLEDNSIIRNDNNPYALYDFNTEEIIKSRADLPKGNLENVNENELIPFLDAALLDINVDKDIENTEIESRKSGNSVYAELYFYIDQKHIAAEFSKFGNSDWELKEISLYDDPDYHYWLSSSIHTMWGTSLHDFNSEEEIELEDLDYTNYNEFKNSKAYTEIESTTESTEQKEESAESQAQEPIELTTGNYIVGEDIPAGKYDIIGVKGGYVRVCSPGKDYGDIVSEAIESNETVYSNVRLKDGYSVEVVLGGKIQLQPK